MIEQEENHIKESKDIDWSRVEHEIRQSIAYGVPPTICEEAWKLDPKRYSELYRKVKQEEIDRVRLMGVR